MLALLPAGCWLPRQIIPVQNESLICLWNDHSLVSLRVAQIQLAHGGCHLEARLLHLQARTEGQMENESHTPAHTRIHTHAQCALHTHAGVERLNEPGAAHTSHRNSPYNCCPLNGWNARTSDGPHMQPHFRVPKPHHAGASTRKTTQSRPCICCRDLTVGSPLNSHIAYRQLHVHGLGWLQAHHKLVADALVAWE